MRAFIEPKLKLHFFPRSVVALLQVGMVSPFLSQASAQTPSPSAVTVLASSQAPVIAFDQKSFDFGKIQFGQTAVHRFKVSNTGQATLHIKEVKAACGCT